MKALREGDSVLGGGNTFRFDFEYQAFVMGARTTLDYLAQTVAAYFGFRPDSFNGFPKVLRKAKPLDASAELADAVAPLHDSLQHFLSDGSVKSVRDRITHYDFVRAGVLNIFGRGAAALWSAVVRAWRSTRREAQSAVAGHGRSLSTTARSNHSNHFQTDRPRSGRHRPRPRRLPAPGTARWLLSTNRATQVGPS